MRQHAVVHDNLVSRPIRRGLLGGTFALIIVAALAGMTLVGVIGSSIDRLHDTVEGSDQLASEAATLRTALLNQETGLRGYQLTGDDAFLQPYRLGLRAEQGALTNLIVEAESESLLLAVREVSRTAEEWRSAWVLPQLELVRDGDLGEVAAQVATGGGKRRFDEVRGALGRVDLAINEIRSEALAAFRETDGTALAVIVTTIIGLGASLAFGAWWTFRRIGQPLDRLVGTAEALERGERVQFVAARRDEIGQLADTLQRLQESVEMRYASASDLAERSTIFNRLGELVSYADDEDAILRAGTAALERLVPNRGGEILLVNPSFDQLRVHAVWGEVQTPAGGRLTIDKPTACPGIRRNAPHLTRSALDAFSLTCAIHPLRSGSLLCIPMVSHNEVLGVIHLERADEDAFVEDDVRTASRVSEQIALAMANLRLMRRMEAQAMTDPLTGLANARFFDPLVERELATARREGRPVGIVMLDLDHFKQFNDTHGHPAGDEALRAFARAVRGTLRESDAAARYGGEEFAVLLHNTDLDGARAVAEKLRSAIELTPIEIGPNRFARITASLGIAASDVHGTDRMQLMRLADAALYEAKRGGRNRVAAGPGAPEQDGSAPTSIRTARRTPETKPGRRAAAGGGFDPAGEPTV